ncbi:hypothetical protein RFN28_27060 [Mesorhizobium sp. VK24D]|uniref:Uncharacterized protein n=1 Tax=Mesorhizobium album TaxID=3072314 RepID=A0ABU4Y705_9HYPH|nr:hypothetical protein [Mesorhizobium sp. VK24D]MDX8482093.1 hypothetical protein [Mesorhizobium sp. VK24D]
MRISFVCSAIFAATAFAAPAMATTDAYVLVETLPGAAVDTNWGFDQCKGLPHSFRPNEMVVQIGCDDLASLNKAVGTDIPAMQGVKRVTLWMLGTGQ